MNHAEKETNKQNNVKSRIGMQLSWKEKKRKEKRKQTPQNYRLNKTIHLFNCKRSFELWRPVDGNNLKHQQLCSSRMQEPAALSGRARPNTTKDGPHFGQHPSAGRYRGPTLCILLDSAVSMENFISQTARSCYYRLHPVSSVHESLSAEVTVKLVISLIPLPRNYFNSLLSCLPAFSVHVLRHIQSCARPKLKKT